MDKYSTTAYRKLTKRIEDTLRVELNSAFEHAKLFVLYYNDGKHVYYKNE